jgi:antitoxin StbD
MAKMAELCDERQLESLLQTRLKSMSRALQVNLDDL